MPPSSGSHHLPNAARLRASLGLTARFYDQIFRFLQISDHSKHSFLFPHLKNKSRHRLILSNLHFVYVYLLLFPFSLVPMALFYICKKLIHNFWACFANRTLNSDKNHRYFAAIRICHFVFSLKCPCFKKELHKIFPSKHL